MLPPSPAPAGAPPDFAAAAQSGDMEGLFVDALRGIIAAIQEQGLDFDDLVLKASSKTQAAPKTPSLEPELPGEVPAPAGTLPKGGMKPPSPLGGGFG